MPLSLNRDETRSCMMDDRLDNTVEIARDLVIPESQDHKSRRLQRGIPEGTVKKMAIEAVMLAIEFDAESGPQTGKIENIACPRHLPPKVQSL